MSNHDLSATKEQKLKRSAKVGQACR